MINGKKIIVVLPAYNAEKTLEKTYREIPFDIVDDIVLVDDSSLDNTFETARKTGITNVILHDSNTGYGGNQKTCYDKALGLGADIIVMLHPDYQYTPLLIQSMCYLITNNLYDVVIGSRILGKGAIKGGMPVYKYLFNRVLTLIQNILMNQKMSEYHTGYRVFTADVLKSLHYSGFSDDFIFDNQVLAMACYLNHRIGEISCPTRYDDQTSSINFRRSVVYGLGVLGTSLRYFLAKTLGLKTGIFRLR